MTLASSLMSDLGFKARTFRLPDPTGNKVSSSDFTNYKGLLAMFFCNHYPAEKHIREAITDFARRTKPRDLAVVGINSNDATTHLADSLNKDARGSMECRGRFSVSL
jgi:hypothetical protein